MRGEETFEVAARDPGPDRGLRVAQVEAALEDCRARLTPEQQVVLSMRYEGELESETIANELGLHRNTVHVRVFRALQSLRECLARKGYEAGDLA
jgi:RNA polymerase sigma factor (sigma-70 family)